MQHFKHYDEHSCNSIDQYILLQKVKVQNAISLGGKHEKKVQRNEAESAKRDPDSYYIANSYVLISIL